MSTTLRELLTAYDLSSLIDAFEREHVTIADLPAMTDRELADTFGLRGYGDRKRFHLMVASLGSATAASPSSADSGKTWMGTPPADPGATRAGPAPADPGATRMDLTPLDPGATRGLTMLGKSIAADSVDLAALPAGTVFDGRYTIVDVLGRGGMGVVYQAVDRRVKQTVALKTLPAGELELLDALAREVALAQHLNHPNLLGVRHLETRGDAPYVVMELMDGGDLEEVLRSQGGKLDPSEARRVLDGVLAGLSALHAARVAHLDVKPANVLLGRDGRVKLADFGISSRMRDQRAGGSGSGTPDYAPPEQLRGAPCDARADVYAVGLLAHVLLAGRLPFEGRAVETIRRWHDSGERVFPLVSPVIEAVLVRAVSVRPDDRYRTAEELRDALMGALQQRCWYALADGVAEGLRGRVSAEARVVGSDTRLSDAAGLLVAGAAVPGWETEAGLVVLHAEPLAAVFAGRELGGEDEALRAGAEALAGRFDSLARLGEQPSAVEASLALAAHLGGDPGLALRRRAMAETSARSVAERLAVANAVRSGVGRVADAWEALSGAERAASSAVEHAHVASFAQTLLGDRATAVRALLAAERTAKSAEDHLVVAQAHLSVAGDGRACGFALERYAAASNHTTDALLVAVRVLGEQPTLLSWAQRLEREAGGDADRLEAVCGVWGALGDAASAARSAAARVRSLDAQFTVFVGRLESIGLSTQLAERAPTPEIIAQLSVEVERQEKFHREALSLNARLEKIGVPSTDWVKPYTEQMVSERRTEVREQERLHRTAWELDARSAQLALPPEVWARPYRTQEVEARAEAVRRQGALSLEAAAVDARRLQLGLSYVAWVLPVSDRAIAAARAELVLYEGWAEEVKELKASARREFGWALLPPRPHDGETVAGMLAALAEQRAWNARVAAVSAPGVATPAFPRSEGSVAAYEGAVARQVRKLRNAAAGVLFIGMAVAGVMAIRTAAEWAEESRLFQQRKAAFVRAEPGVEAASPSLGTMRWVPPGSFMMGSPAGELGRGMDETQVLVTLTQGFWMMDHEVTQGEWLAVMGNNPSLNRPGGLNCPVEQVSWDDAVEFAKRVSTRDGVIYRLPTEAEWEYAARGGEPHVYAGGNDVDAVGWHADISGGKTHSACTKRRNAYGLCDMSGNVWEWTADLYGNYLSGGVKDPSGALSGEFRVLRGGGWTSPSQRARVAERGAFSPRLGNVDLGFRLVRTRP
jgi:formylglycine-generating enzyme required for sulfatase activity